MRRLRFVFLLLTPLILAAFSFRLGLALSNPPVTIIVPTVSQGERLDTLLTWLALHDIHGETDNGKSFSTLSKLILQRPLVLTCEYISAYAVQVLTETGFRAREVQTLTLEPFNCCNNGHTVFEVNDPPFGWVVVDLDYNRMYLENALEWAVKRTMPIILANDPILDLVEFPNQPAPDVESPDIYPRNLGVIGISDASGYMFDCTTEDRERVEGYAPNFHCLSDIQFRATFGE